MAFCHWWRDCDKAACPKITSVRSKAARPLVSLSFRNFHPRALTCIFFVHYRPCPPHTDRLQVVRASWWKFFPFPGSRPTKNIRCFIPPLRRQEEISPLFPFYSRYILLIKLFRAKHEKISRGFFYTDFLHFIIIIF